jgi:hypothetical protein
MCPGSDDPIVRRTYFRPVTPGSDRPFEVWCKSFRVRFRSVPDLVGSGFPASPFRFPQVRSGSVAPGGFAHAVLR